ncbi:winged helix-turn-helix transcriptional regulator [Rhizobium sp. NRK18]|uniref:winged helix-turn-helix transcriptional regulator n=1 Tax=Rhizobium sp. NRK18 TaxID=2964667 RepID=UPI0021C3B53C|nr:helix-turn-helix domain-containing protein [Rhizobium sp. NRK18]MCQ2004952.1 helix-turn-helix transcriptional regulator [Rhizobium sp. NRK18]
MSKDGYNQFCPVAKACELLEPRWTLLLLCEMWSGSTRFNEIRRGVPGMSPTLMSKRLKEMEENGLIVRHCNERTGDINYLTTPLCDELQPIVHALGEWAHRNIDAEVTLEHLDARLLMWNMRRKVDVTALPPGRRSVIKFTFQELPREEQDYWLISRPGGVPDLCVIDPGHDVDLFILADLKALTSAWMGHASLAAEIARERIVLVGDQEIAAAIGRWMVRSSYAGDRRPMTDCRRVV